MLQLSIARLKILRSLAKLPVRLLSEMVHGRSFCSAARHVGLRRYFACSEEFAALAVSVFAEQVQFVAACKLAGTHIVAVDTLIVAHSTRLPLAHSNGLTTQVALELVAVAAQEQV